MKSTTLVLVSFLALALTAPAAYAGGFSFNLGSGGLAIPIPARLPFIGGGHSSSGQGIPMTPHNQAVAALNEGFELSKQGREQEATAKFKQAIQIDPNYELAWFDLVNSDISSGDLSEGMDVSQQFLTRFPSSARGARVSALRQRMHDELDKKEKALASGAPPDDYLALATAEHGSRRWSTQEMPIKVYLETGHGVKGYRSSFADDMRSAFGEWANASQGALSFQFVNDPASAKIVCKWIDDGKYFPEHSGIEGGEALPYFTANGTIVSATIYILTTDPKHLITEAAIAHTCLHEVGHVLGLCGHSDSPNDILYWAGSQQLQQETHLSQRDITTIARLYGTVPNPAMDNRSLASTAPYMMPQPDASNYGEQASPTAYAPAGYGPESAFQMQPQLARVQAPLQNAWQQQLSTGYPTQNMQQQGLPMNANMNNTSMNNTSMNNTSMNNMNMNNMNMNSMNMNTNMNQMNPNYSAPTAWQQSMQQPIPQQSPPNHSIAVANADLPLTMRLQPKKIPTMGKYNRAGLGSTDQALSTLERAVLSNPNDMSALDDLGTAYNNRAVESAAQGKTGLAEQYYDRALAILRNSQDSSKMTNTLSNYVLLLQKQNRSQEAERLKERCAEFVAKYRLSQSM